MIDLLVNAFVDSGGPLPGTIRFPAGSVCALAYVLHNVPVRASLFPACLAAVASIRNPERRLSASAKKDIVGVATRRDSPTLDSCRRRATRGARSRPFYCVRYRTHDGVPRI
jgi:hypothetical protein